MWLEYNNAYANEGNKKRVKVAVFKRIIAAITFSGECEMKCVDYVYTNLVADPVN